MGKNSKRKKSYYLTPAKRQRLNSIIGSVGFLATCNSNEYSCVREGYNLLNEYADKMYGPEKAGENGAEEIIENSNSAAGNESNSSDDEDVDAALKKEVAEVQKLTNAYEAKTTKRLERKRRFEFQRINAPNNVFFRTTLLDPLPLLQSIMDSILMTGKQCTRHIIRLLPVHVVCKAFLEKVEKALTTFCSAQFKDAEKTFYCVIKVTNNTSIKKEELLGVVLKVMEEVAPKCKPTLTVNAEVSIILTVFTSNCYIGVAPLYLGKYKKYNLIEIANYSSKTVAHDSVPSAAGNSQTEDIEQKLGIQSSVNLEIAENNEENVTFTTTSSQDGSKELADTSVKQVADPSIT